MSTLLINGCSFGHIWKPTVNFVEQAKCDDIKNISRLGTSFQRTLRTTIEWVAQNGNPSMVVIPITFAHRWELPICDDEKFGPIDGIWMPLQANTAIENAYPGSKFQLGSEEDNIKKINDLYYGLISNTVGYWDKMFTEIISLCAFLEQRKIPYLMWDMCNDFDEDLLINHSFVQKAQLIKQNKKVINIFSFCGNKYMWRLKERNIGEPFNQHWGSEEYKGLESYILQYIHNNEILQ